MGLSDRIANHFRENVFYGGLTYNAHPMCLAAADAVIDVIENEKLVERSAQMGEVMRGHMAKLKAKHPSIREHRNIGLFGIIELRKNEKGDRLVPYNSSHPAMAKLGKFFRENGLFTVLQWGGVMCNPPLTISEAEMAQAFDIIDRGLAITDEAFEK
jgi:taurine--2-oxoglutarate transaminase